MSIDNENELEFSEEAESEHVEQEAPSEDVEQSSEEPVEYTPNYSYKVKDEEFEFDEVLRGAITNAEAEERLRELYTKSAGLDAYKGRYSELKSQTEALVSGYKTLKELRDSGNLRDLFGTLNVSNEQLLEYVDSMLAEQELPEEQRKILEENRKLETRLKELEGRVSTYDHEIGNKRIEDEVRELETLITSDTYMPVAQAMKSVGLNMQDEVLSAGHMEFARTGKEPTVSSVVQKVAQKYSYLVKKQEEQQVSKPSIPSLRGANASAVGTKIKSIEDIKRLASSKF